MPSLGQAVMVLRCRFRMYPPNHLLKVWLLGFVLWNFRRWGLLSKKQITGLIPLEGILESWPIPCFCFAFWIPWVEQPPPICTLSVMILFTRPEPNRTYWPWTKVSETINQNNLFFKLFLLLHFIIAVKIGCKCQT